MGNYKKYWIKSQCDNNLITTIGELGGVLSNVTPTAAAMGVEFEQVGAAIASMTAQGTPAAQATTQLNSMFAELGKQGTKASQALIEATKGTEHAGKSFQDLQAEGVPLNEILDLMQKQADETGVGILDMFSSIEAGKGALAISGANSEGFTENLKAMSTETDVVGDAFDKVSDTSANKFDKIINQLKNTAITLFTAMMPLIDEIFPVLTELLEMLIPIISDVVLALMPVFVEVVKKLVPPLLKVVEKLLPPLVRLLDALMPILLPLIDLFVELLDTAFLPLIEALLPLIEVILPPLVQLLEALSPIVSGLAQVLSSVLVSAVNTAKGAFETLMTVLGPAFELLVKIGEVLGDVMGGIGDAITGGGSTQSYSGYGTSSPASSYQYPGFASGISNVPYDMTANIHKGEGILTAEDNDRLFNLEAMASNGNVSNSSNNSNNIVVQMNNSISNDYDVNRMGSIFTNKLLNEGVL